MGTLRNFSLFSGAGGLDLGAKLAGGIQTVGYCERDRYAQGVLRSRIGGGQLDCGPIWDDVTTLDGRPWRGRLDCVSGGFPCQDASQAGKRAGLKEGTRTGLWLHIVRFLQESGAGLLLAENVRGLLSVDSGRGFGTVLGDLARIGFDARWFVLSAAAVGAPHRRERVWIIGWDRERFGVGQADPELRGRLHGQLKVLSAEAGLLALGDAGAEGALADTKGVGQSRPKPEGNSGRQPQGQIGSGSADLAHAKEPGLIRAEQLENDKENKRGGRGLNSHAEGQVSSTTADAERERLEGLVERWSAAWPANGSSDGGDRSWWGAEPNVGRVANGVAARVDRLRLCGNGVVPQQSVPAWEVVKAIAART